MQYVDGAIKVPTKPGLGVEIDRDKLGKYADLYKSLGGYPYDRDPSRPDWFSVLPNTRWADPNDDRVVDY
jgi:glucarate dehydratase